MNCIIIDDEPLALAQLKSYIERIPFLTLIEACQDTTEAIKALTENHIDLIFSDINMPDLNGIDFVHSLVDSPMIIFTTAYSEYAIEGFRLNAIDYLLKPFSFQDCLRASEKAKQMYQYQHNKGKAETQENDNILFVKSEYKVIRIEKEKIKYIEGMSEYIRIYLEDREKPVITLNSLQKLSNHLPDYFLRVHRSYIVNMKKVLEISRFRILFDHDTIIPVGDNYKEQFLAYINKQGLL